MNYQESREYIDKITREIPSVLGLDHMRELMKRLGNPQDDLKYVHIAGTNGKGSVIAFLLSLIHIFETGRGRHSCDCRNGRPSHGEDSY